MLILDKNSQEILFDKAHIADSFYKRLVGLLAKKQIDENYALYFANTNSIHTIGMRFDIGVIYLNNDNKIVDIVDTLKPYRFSLNKESQHLIEIQAGLANKLALKINQQLEFKS